MATFHLLIEGIVQGVFYRASAKRLAGEIGVTGWVRNTKDGQVEIMAQGTDADVRNFVEWCKKGPPGARVEKVEVSPVHEQPFEGFKILR